MVFILFISSYEGDRCVFLFFFKWLCGFCVVIIYSIIQYCVNNEIIDYIINKIFCLFIGHLTLFYYLSNDKLPINDIDFYYHFALLCWEIFILVISIFGI